MSKKQTSGVVTYTREELIAGSAGFGVRPEVMAGALRLADRDRMTRDEARKAVEMYLKREV